MTSVRWRTVVAVITSMPMSLASCETSQSKLLASACALGMPSGLALCMRVGGKGRIAPFLPVPTSAFAWCSAREPSLCLLPTLLSLVHFVGHPCLGCLAVTLAQQSLFPLPAVALPPGPRVAVQFPQYLRTTVLRIQEGCFVLSALLFTSSFFFLDVSATDGR